MMASTYAGDKLTEEHRQQQVHLADLLGKSLLTLFWRLFRWNDIDRSCEEFARAAAPEVARYRETSRMLSVDYMHAFQQVEAPDAPVPIEEPDDLDPDEIVRQILATARGVSKTLSRKGYSEEDASQRTAQAVVGKATKLAGDGGRKVIEQEVRRGNGPVGYARVVDADPCPFCAMLASRGLYLLGKDANGAGLYRSDAFDATNTRFVGDGRFKVHDHCCCTMEPVYRVNGKINLPGNGNQLAKEWAEVASGQDDPEGAWRRWRVSGTLPENYDGPLDGTRRPAPAHGQSTGRRRRPKPAKASERAEKWNKPNRHAGDWDSQRYREYADELSLRADRVLAEADALRAAGQTDDDVAVMALNQEHRALLKRIKKYRAEGDRLAAEGS